MMFTWLPAEQRIIERRHDTSEIPRPEMKSDLRSRFRYLVYKSSSCEFSGIKREEKENEGMHAKVSSLW
jgi:hypothetical protein